MNILRLPRLAALFLLAAAFGCSATPATTPAAPGASASAPSVPSASPPAGSSTVYVVLSNVGCAPDRASVPAGSVVIDVINDGGDKVTELELMDGDRVMAERENLTPGLSGTITLVLEPGTYDLYCPGATTERSPLEVTPAS